MAAKSPKKAQEAQKKKKGVSRPGETTAKKVSLGRQRRQAAKREE